MNDVTVDASLMVCVYILITGEARPRGAQVNEAQDSAGARQSTARLESRQQNHSCWSMRHAVTVTSHTRTCGCVWTYLVYETCRLSVVLLL